METEIAQEKYLGRLVSEKLVFENEGIWAALRAAESHLLENGYEYGSLCFPMPMAFTKGEYNLPQKWKNMNRAERNSVSGVVVGDYREGPVTICIFNP